MSHHLAATKLACILDDMTEKNDILSWVHLFTFSTHFLAISRRGGRQCNFAMAVNKKLREEGCVDLISVSPLCKLDPHSSSDIIVSLAKRVS